MSRSAEVLEGRPLVRVVDHVQSELPLFVLDRDTADPSPTGMSGIGTPIPCMRGDILRLLRLDEQSFGDCLRRRARSCAGRSSCRHFG
jgi:hypothetical protein